MSSTWDLLSRIFEDAAARPPSERAAFLDAECPDELRDQVDAMLASDTTASRYFGDLELAITTSASREGLRLGPWQIGERIGQGGMGTVYSAKRADGAFEQEVAIKVLDSVRPDVVARFERERQILARLNHPGIARLLDGGATPEGHPYLVMERVHGEPITDYATHRQLDVDARLALFVEVCTVVQAAHQQLVIHRDLKPSNVFVTADGQVKLLDFGIAQLVDGPEDQPRTLTSHRALTPEYAAPEQVRGDVATTATDVYALGVLLYELLAGTRPFDLPRQLAHEAARAVLDEAPERPSTAITRSDAERLPASLRVIQRRLEGDLDQICLMALRKEAERRYGTAEAFARDVRRHLDGLPVDARPDALGYRTSRFIRRHRKAIAGVGLAVIALAALGWTHTARLSAERDRAERLTSYVLDLFGSADPWTNEALPTDASFADALHLAAQRAEADLDGADRLRVLQALRATMTGLSDPQFVPVARRIHELATEDFGPDSPEAARATATLAWAIKAEAPEEADSLFRAALTQSDRLHGVASSEAAQVRSDFGFFLKGHRQHDEAEPLLAKAVAAFRAGGEPSRQDLATALEHWSVTLAGLDRAEEANAATDEALAIHVDLHGEDSVPYASALANAATVASGQGDSELAVERNRTALRILDGTLPPDNSLVLTITNNLAVSTEDPAEGLRLYRRILGVHRSQGTPDPPSVIQNIAAAHLAAATLDSAAVWASRARQVYLASPEANTPQASFPNLTFAFARLQQGNATEGRAAAQTAARELAERIAPDHWVVVYAEGLVGWADALQGNREQATPRIRAALDVLASRPDRADQAQLIREEALRLGVDVD